MTLSSASAVSPTFTAPTVSEETDLVFGLKVTDPAGLQSLTATVRVTVRPDNRGITLSKSDLTVPEGGEAEYTVKLAVQPLAEVTVRVARKSGPEDRSLTVKRRTKAPGRTLTFTTSNWNSRPDREDPGRRGRRRRQRLRQVHPHRERRWLRRHHRPAHRHRERQRHPGHRPLGRESHGRRELHQGLQGQARHQAQRRRHRHRRPQEHRHPGLPTSASRPARRSTFTTSNWNSDQTVTLEAGEDHDGDDGTAVIRHTASGGGYGSVTAELTATEDDNDTKALHPVLVHGGHGHRGLHQGLQDQARHPTQRRRHRHRRPQEHRHPGLPTSSVETGSSLTFTTSNWNSDQTVTLEADEDHDGDNGTAVIRHTASGGGYGSGDARSSPPPSPTTTPRRSPCPRPRESR